jgi:hypothetical protein
MPYDFAELEHLLNVVQEVADDCGRSRLHIIVTNKDTDERRELSAAYHPQELASQIREALRRSAQVDALVTLGRAIVQAEAE